MLRLRPYKACDAGQIVKWCKTEYAFRQWSADRYDRYPITAAEMNAYYDADKNNDTIWALTAFDDSGVVGHLTMRYPQEDKREIRFGFVIVDDTKRSKGYGKKLVTLAIRYAFELLQAEKISLGVFENNTAAQNCYKACGFQRAAQGQTTSYVCMGEQWNCIEMELYRDKIV